MLCCKLAANEIETNNQFYNLVYLGALGPGGTMLNILYNYHRVQEENEFKMYLTVDGTPGDGGYLEPRLGEWLVLILEMDPTGARKL